jgi:hypothetical protein
MALWARNRAGTRRIQDNIAEEWLTEGERLPRADRQGGNGAAARHFKSLKIGA